MERHRQSAEEWVASVRPEDPAMNAGLRWHLLHAAAGVATAALLYWLVYGSAGPPSVGEPADLPSSACAPIWDHE